MPQQDYNAPANRINQALQPKFEKSEDSLLPAFTKEVPLRNIIKRHNDNIIIEYEWNLLGGEEIQISFITFKKDEKLQYVHKLKIKEGAEVGYFKVDNTTYAIRKTTESIAKELYKTSGLIKASVLQVIGYFKTMKGNFYTVSRLDGDSWALDPRLGAKTFSLRSINDEERRKLSDLVTEELLKLYRAGYSLAKFSLMDLVITKRKVVLANLSNLVKAKPSARVDNFVSNLRTLVRGGISRKEDVTYGVALSLGAMRKDYAAWVKEHGMSEREEVEVLEKLETEVLN